MGRSRRRPSPMMTTRCSRRRGRRDSRRPGSRPPGWASSSPPTGPPGVRYAGGTRRSRRSRRRASPCSSANMASSGSAGHRGRAQPGHDLAEHPGPAADPPCRPGRPPPRRLRRTRRAPRRGPPRRAPRGRAGGSPMPSTPVPPARRSSTPGRSPRSRCLSRRRRPTPDARRCPTGRRRVAHRGQVQPLAVGGRQRGPDIARRVPHGECQQLRRRRVGGEHQMPVARDVVDHYDRPPRRHCRDRASHPRIGGSHSAPPRRHAREAPKSAAVEHQW